MPLKACEHTTKGGDMNWPRAPRFSSFRQDFSVYVCGILGIRHQHSVILEIRSSKARVLKFIIRGAMLVARELTRAYRSWVRGSGNSQQRGLIDPKPLQRGRVKLPRNVYNGIV